MRHAHFLEVFHNTRTWYVCAYYYQNAPNAELKNSFGPSVLPQDLVASRGQMSLSLLTCVSFAPSTAPCTRQYNYHLCGDVTRESHLRKCLKLSRRAFTTSRFPTGPALTKVSPIFLAVLSQIAVTSRICFTEISRQAFSNCVT